MYRISLHQFVANSGSIFARLACTGAELCEMYYVAKRIAVPLSGPNFGLGQQGPGLGARAWEGGKGAPAVRKELSNDFQRLLFRNL